MTYIQEQQTMFSSIIHKLKNLVSTSLDNSYMTYQKHADRNLVPFLKTVMKDQPFHPKHLLTLALFRVNKHKYIINKRDIFNALVALEQTNKNEFLNSAVGALDGLFKSTRFDKPVGNVINSQSLANLESGFFINPFTNQPIELSILEDDVNKCIRFSTKYLFVGENDTTTVVVNEKDITDITELMRLSDDLADREALAKEYTIYHELSHDSHFQNYRLYKDAVKMKVDIPMKTKRLQEIEADISSILYIIKDRKLSINDAFEVINGVMNFRCGINYKTVWDSSLKCLTEDSIHYHITQPALLVLSRMINDEGVRFIHQISALEITNIAYHIADSVDDDFYFHNYKALLPEDSNEFQRYLLDTTNENLVFFYLLSYYGAEVVNYAGESLEFRKAKFDEMANHLVKKVYSNDELIVQNTLCFRTLVSFQYAVNITPEKIQKLYLCDETKAISSVVYDNFLERFVFKKNIEIEHTRNNINVTIK